MCLVHLGLFLLALSILSSQMVQAQNATEAPMLNTTKPNNTMTTLAVDVTEKGKSSCGRTDAFTLLLPLALGASLLHSWS
ncbi:hypothetical protein E3U43_014968 [Xyrichtys novacula]|uniref:Uncharacterized protein n=1 Tax=Xyrichtys novacula TaxID=13765 RepID=A0AAV1GMT8_XYRNO|nr:hypothetical protein E3U43_014968 [Xyrichtys novacula]